MHRKLDIKPLNLQLETTTNNLKCEQSSRKTRVISTVNITTLANAQLLRIYEYYNASMQVNSTYPTATVLPQTEKQQRKPLLFSCVSRTTSFVSSHNFQTRNLQSAAEHQTQHEASFFNKK